MRRPPYRRKPRRRTDWSFYGFGGLLVVAAFLAVLFWPEQGSAPLFTQGPEASSRPVAGTGAGQDVNRPVNANRVVDVTRPAIANRSPSATQFDCRVSRVSDGDSLRCADGTRIRLHAVAARETDGTCSPGHPCPNASAASATAKLNELARGQTLRCEKTGASYDRVTAICRTQANVEINCAMVRSGTALVWPRFNAERPICT
jgi:endonuclease YncB( thermonuclease family)